MALLEYRFGERRGEEKSYLMPGICQTSLFNSRGVHFGIEGGERLPCSHKKLTQCHLEVNCYAAINILYTLLFHLLLLTQRNEECFDHFGE